MKHEMLKFREDIDVLRIDGNGAFLSILRTHPNSREIENLKKSDLRLYFKAVNGVLICILETEENTYRTFFHTATYSAQVEDYEMLSNTDPLHLVVIYADASSGQALAIRYVRLRADVRRFLLDVWADQFKSHATLQDAVAAYTEAQQEYSVFELIEKADIRQ